MEGRMLPLPGFVRRAIFAEYEPEVEYLDVIAWRKSPHAPYLVANAHARKAGNEGLARLGAPLIRPPALATLRNQHGQLERLLVVQPRIDGRPVCPLQVPIGKATGAPRALGDVLAGELDMHTAEVGPHFRVDPERQVQLFEDVLKPPRLQPTHRGLGIAVHGIADPQHRLAGLPYRLDRARQGGLDVLRPEPVNESQTPRLILRIECRHQPLQPRRIHRRADFHADRVGNTAEVFDVRAIELRGAHSDPRHMRRQVVPAVLAWDETCLRLLVEEMQSLVARVEINQCRLSNAMTADALEEVECVADRAHDALIGVLELRVLHEPEIPILRVV